jgi:hypothetical protein
VAIVRLGGRSSFFSGPDQPSFYGDQHASGHTLSFSHRCERWTLHLNDGKHEWMLVAMKERSLVVEIIVRLFVCSFVDLADGIWKRILVNCLNTPHT